MSIDLDLNNDILTGGLLSNNNNTTTPLISGSIFTGTEELNSYSHVMVVVKTDQEGTIYLDFSPDGTNWDSTIEIPYDPTLINPPQPLLKGPRYFRVRFRNTSLSNQTYIRLYTYFGQYTALTSNLKSVIPQTFPSAVIRPIDFNLMVAKDLYQGHQLIIKDGINTDIDSATVPEDIWGNGGTYTGFPSAAAAAEIQVAGADTGTVFYSYMESSTDTEYSFGSIAIAGAGTYALGHDVWRSNYMLFTNGSSFNVDNITLRHTATPTNIFGVILQGQGQTFNAAYTVPQGHSVFLDRITGSIRGGNTGAACDMFFYYKPSGSSPLLRFPFVLNFGGPYFDDIDYLVRIPSGVDFIPRATSCTNNNTSVHVSYRILKVKD